MKYCPEGWIHSATTYGHWVIESELLNIWGKKQSWLQNSGFLLTNTVVTALRCVVPSVFLPQLQQLVTIFILHISPTIVTLKSWIPRSKTMVILYFYIPLGIACTKCMALRPVQMTIS